jgi:DNA-binding response OmpR family regulator
MQHVPVLDAAPDAAVQALEGAYTEFEVLRRRIEQVRADVEDYRRTAAGAERESWAKADAAAKRASASLELALAALPPLPPLRSSRAPLYEVEALRIMVTERRVTFDGRPVPLANKELELLIGLAREPTRVYTKAELLRDIWDYRSPGRTRTLDSHASRLRSKLVAAGAPKGRYVIAVWGVGYSLVRS